MIETFLLLSIASNPIVLPDLRAETEMGISVESLSHYNLMCEKKVLYNILVNEIIFYRKRILFLI